MIADFVAGRGYLARDPRAAADIVTAHEKSGGNRVPSQDFEQRWSRFTGAVIEGQRERGLRPVAMINGGRQDPGGTAPDGVTHASRGSQESRGADERTVQHRHYDTAGILKGVD